MKKTIILIVLLITQQLLTAQSYRQKGVVCDATNRETLEGVNVLLYADHNKKLVAYTTTTAKGVFTIAIPDSLIDKAYIQFSYMGYETQQRKIDKHSHWEVFLTQKEMEIKEVIVKAPKIRMQGDTLTYDVRLFSKEGDRSIADVLQRMPGIKTAENGQISYNGIPINRFYIENSDMLEGQYGLATNNIPGKEVGSVEVMQNHQPVKALEGIAFSEQAAINLRLKENVKHRWIGTLKGEAGMSANEGLWNVQGVFMRFTKKQQSLNSIKTNNTGQDTSKELTSFNRKAVENRKNLLADYIGVEPPYTMGLNRSRELMNQTHQVSSHNLFTLKNGTDVKVNIAYQRHAEDAEKETESIYYEGKDESQRLYESERSDYAKDLLSATLSTEINKPTYSLTERFQLELDWKRKEISMDGYSTNQQDLYAGSKKAVNDLFLLKRSGNTFFNFSSYTLVHTLPQNIHVRKIDDEVVQSIDQKQVFSDNSLGWGIVVGRTTIDFTGNLTGMYKKMNSQLTGMEENNIPAESSFGLGYLKSSLTAKATYLSGIFKAIATLPVSYYYYNYKHIQEKVSTYNRLSLSSSLYAELSFNSRWSIYARGNVSEQPINTQLFYPAGILTSYRTYTQGISEFCHTKSMTITGGVEYNIPLSEYFSRLEFSQSRNEIPYILSQTIDHNYIVSNYTLTPLKTNRSSISGSISKSTDWKRSTFSLQSGWSRSDSQLFRNEQELQNCRTQFYLKPEIDMNLTNWFNIRYALLYNRESLSINKSDSKESTQIVKQTLVTHFTLSNKFNFSITGEHYSNKISTRDTHNFFLADLFLTYKFSNRFSIDGRLTNLFNEKRYSYTYFTHDATRVTRSYNIRPRNFLLGLYMTF